MRKTYKEIATLMDGAVSPDWCKRMLKHVKEDSPESLVYGKPSTPAARPEGVTYTECCEILVDNGVCVLL